jgi:drug/metabolite transporter (DMT)-like permease
MTLAHARANRAILFICAAYALYSTGDAILKYIGTDLPVGTIMMVGGGIMTALSVLALAVAGKIPEIWRSEKRILHMTRMVIVGGLAFCATNALRTIPLSDFYGILFMSPFLVGIFAYFFFKEEIGVHRVIATIGGFVGVIILAGPHFNDVNPGYIYAFLQLFLVAAHVLLVRRLGTRDPWPLLTFFPGMGIFIVGLFLFIPNPVWPDIEWMPILTVYALAIFVGQIAFSVAFAITPLMAIIAPYLYTQMLWGVLFGIFLFGHVPTPTTAIGASIIITSGICNLLYERYLRRRAFKKQKAEGKPTV